MNRNKYRKKISEQRTPMEHAIYSVYRDVPSSNAKILYVFQHVNIYVLKIGKVSAIPYYGGFYYNCLTKFIH